MFKRTLVSTFVAAFAVLAVSSFTHAAPIAAGDVIGADMGTVAGGDAVNFNIFNSNTTIGAGSVVRIADGASVDGVSLTFAGAGGFANDPNANAWPGTGADPYYSAAADDISFGGTQTLTYAGLDPSLIYNVRIYSLIGNNPTARENFVVTDGAGTTGINDSTRGSRWNAATLETGGTVFNGVGTNAAGQIAVSAVPVNSNAFFNAVTLEAVAATVQVGTKIGIDFGSATVPTPTDTFGNDWNEVNSNNVNSVAVHDLNGHTLDGVSLSSSGGGFNNAGEDNWVGLSSQGGDAPVEFVDSVTTDIVFNPVTVTLDGLAPNLFYDITVVSNGGGAGFDSRQDAITITGDVVYGPSVVNRGDARTLGLFHTFLGVATDANGTLTFVTSAPSNNPAFTGILIEAIPAPAALPAGLAMLGLVAARRRRR